MKTEFVRDVPVGVLLIVLSQFFIYVVSYIAKFPVWWEMLVLIGAMYIFNYLIETGIALLFGVNVPVDKNDSDKK